jgi:hypothetical protein
VEPENCFIFAETAETGAENADDENYFSGSGFEK